MVICKDCNTTLAIVKTGILIQMSNNIYAGDELQCTLCRYSVMAHFGRPIAKSGQPEFEGYLKEIEKQNG